MPLINRIAFNLKHLLVLIAIAALLFCIWVPRGTPNVSFSFRGNGVLWVENAGSRAFWYRGYGGRVIDRNVFEWRDGALILVSGQSSTESDWTKVSPGGFVTIDLSWLQEMSAGRFQLWFATANWRGVESDVVAKFCIARENEKSRLKLEDDVKTDTSRVENDTRGR